MFYSPPHGKLWSAPSSALGTVTVLLHCWRGFRLGKLEHLTPMDHDVLTYFCHRRFPPAVYNRISGIMLDDDAVSPWASTSSETSSS